MFAQESSQKGFTLIEILIALTIFAIGLLGIAGMQITAMQEGNSAHARTAGNSVAQGVMEDILARSGDDSIFTAATGNWTDWVFASGDLPNQGMGTYQVQYKITIDYPTDLPKLATVEVKADGEGRQATLTGFKRLQ
jgi:type IV pilus assembly protein PilV